MNWFSFNSAKKDVVSPLSPEERLRQKFNSYSESYLTNSHYLKEILDQFKSEDAYAIAQECLVMHRESELGKPNFKISGNYLSEIVKRFGQSANKKQDSQASSLTDRIYESIEKVTANPVWKDARKQNETEYLRSAANTLAKDPENIDFKNRLTDLYIKGGDTYLEELEIFAQEEKGNKNAKNIWKKIKSKWKGDKKGRHLDSLPYLLNIANAAGNEKDRKECVDALVNCMHYPETKQAYKFVGEKPLGALTKIVRYDPSLVDNQAMDKVRHLNGQLLMEPLHYSREKSTDLLTGYMNFWSAAAQNKPEYTIDAYNFAAQTWVLALEKVNRGADSYCEVWNSAEKLIVQTENAVRAKLLTDSFKENTILTAGYTGLRDRVNLITNARLDLKIDNLTSKMKPR
jgi:hypothetical protein